MASLSTVIQTIYIVFITYNTDDVYTIITELQKKNRKKLNWLYLVRLIKLLRNQNRFKVGYLILHRGIQSTCALFVVSHT